MFQIVVVSVSIAVAATTDNILIVVVQAGSPSVAVLQTWGTRL